MYHRRGYQTAHNRHIAALDLLLFIVLLLSAWYAVAPLEQDLAASSKSQRAISQMTSVSDNTTDPKRKKLLREAQAFNGELAGGEGGVDNAGMRGGNEGTKDILSLAEPGEEPTLPYEHQLSEEPTTPLCWLEVPAASIAQPVYHTTTDEVLAQGVGHLASSSLPVGGTSSRCVLAGHSGMEHAHMFDHLDEVGVGDVVILHTLGDAYWYEVYQTEVVTPEEAEQRCEIEAGEDLCTLVTCTPYGINSHRLLVHARRIPAQSVRPRRRSAYKMISDRRTAPPLALACMLGTPVVVGLAGRLRRRARKDYAWMNTTDMRSESAAPNAASLAMPDTMARPSSTRKGSFVRSSHAALPLPPSPHGTKAKVGHGWAWRLGVPLGTILCLGAVAVAGHVTREGTGYRRLEQQVVSDSTAGEGDSHTNMPKIDWEILRDINPDIAAWVEVDGTDVSLPVVAPSDDDMVFYLRHNLWRQWSLQGVPFLDHRCEADGPHRIVYGHHLSSGGQFSQLQRAYEQATFDMLGLCRWSTPEEGSATLVPLCALSVDQWHEDIQRFAFADKEELHGWLTDLCNDATARVRDWREVVGKAESVLTLVTCTSDMSDQPWRTLVVFAETSARPSTC